MMARRSKRTRNCLKLCSQAMGAFDDPAGFAKAAAMRLAAASNLGADAVGMQRLAIFVVVVSTITRPVLTRPHGTNRRKVT